MIPTPKLHQVRGLDWAESECLVSWATLGLVQAGPGEEVSCVASSQAGHLLAAGDELGRLRLYSRPACQPVCGYQARTSVLITWRVFWSVSFQVV